MTPTHNKTDDTIITAAMLAIGDELLSGRTKDKNIVYLAEKLMKTGIDLKEVRIIADDENAIIEAVNSLRSQYHYLFTSGGIGPTHDDITAESISKAFGLPCIFDFNAEQILAHYYKERDLPFTAARRLMTRMPEGAILIDNPISAAPGFRIDNVFVMAGVPSIFQVMLDSILPTLERGAQIYSVAIICPFGEGTISPYLAKIQKEHPATSIGSYPSFAHNDKNEFRLELVIRSRNYQALEAAQRAISAMIAALETEERQQ